MKMKINRDYIHIANIYIIQEENNDHTKLCWFMVKGHKVKFKKKYKEETLDYHYNFIMSKNVENIFKLYLFMISFVLYVIGRL